MQAALVTLIGVMGAGIISVFILTMRMLGSKLDRLESIVEKIFHGLHALDIKVTGEIHALDIKVTGEIHALDTKVTGLAGEVQALDTKVTGLAGEVKAQGERLARIEAHLDINPPAEAA